MSAGSSIAVGITGHRPNRLLVGAGRVAERLRVALTAIKRGIRSGPRQIAKLVAISPIAEGSDRLFAEAALSLGFEVDALLPMPGKDYETTFSDTHQLAVYRNLLSRSASITELPGTLDESTAAYEAVGQTIADRSQILIAVWDGKPAAGRGGTPEIIAYAISIGRPVIWIDAARHRSPLLLRGSNTGRDVPLATLAKRAEALTGANIAALAGRL